MIVVINLLRRIHFDFPRRKFGLANEYPPIVEIVGYQFVVGVVVAPLFDVLDSRLLLSLFPLGCVLHQFRSSIHQLLPVSSGREGEGAQSIDVLASFVFFYDGFASGGKSGRRFGSVMDFGKLLFGGFVAVGSEIAEGGAVDCLSDVRGVDEWRY